MDKTLIKNGLLFNRGKSFQSDILIEGKRISKIAPNISDSDAEIIDAAQMWVIPGIIDDQVHFREPGLTHKAEIETESKAAVSGGVTTFMEMPNVKPATLTQELLEKKYAIGADRSWTNYSFFMGASNDNIEEVLKTNKSNVCGVKIFMGSSTGNMLVDNEKVLENLFSKVDMLIATHCEDEATIRANMELFKSKYGDDLTAHHHPLIRNVEGCYKSSSFAIDLAKKHNTRLHILHISTEEETELFRNDIQLSEKRITAEACVHHMFFSASDYEEKGNDIKCNPAIKSSRHRDAVLKALLDNRIDIIATDHAPHTREEKDQHYSKAPSGLPLVQHSLNVMMDLFWNNKITMERIVEKMCHAPAECFKIKDRGYLDEGSYADIAIMHPTQPWTVNQANLLYKCGWSPLEDKRFKGKVNYTFINGTLVYNQGLFQHQGSGERVLFDRE
jgi:dihydroorotase